MCIYIYIYMYITGLPMTPMGLEDADNLAGLRGVGAREGRLTGGIGDYLTQVATCACTMRS